MDHPVENVAGVGAARATALKMYNITTVKQLADANLDVVKVSGIKSIVDNAKLYIVRNTVAPSKVEPPKITLSSVLPPPINFSFFGKKLSAVPLPIVPAPVETPKVEEKPATDSDVEEYPEPENSDYLIKDHSWWEMKVLIPRGLLPSAEDTALGLREAIVYEMSIEPHDRVAFVCCWVLPDESKKEKLCSMTYSPQLLFFFNMDLPPLTISIRPEDAETLPNMHTIKNVIYEIDLMQKYK